MAVLLALFAWFVIKFFLDIPGKVAHGSQNDIRVRMVKRGFPVTPWGQYSRALKYFQVVHYGCAAEGEKLNDGFD